MISKLAKIFFVFIIFFTVLSSVYAQDKIAISGGCAFGHEGHRNLPWTMVEYRSNAKIFIFHPWIGVGGTDQDIYTAIGASYFFDINKFYLGLHFGAGAYHGEAEGLELGHGVEFMSSVELGYKFENNFSLGVKFSHISNADLGDSNPGSEILTLIICIPIPIK